MRPPCITEANVSSYVTDVRTPHTLAILHVYDSIRASVYHDATSLNMAAICRSDGEGGEERRENRRVNDAQNGQAGKLLDSRARFTETTEHYR